MEADVAGVFVSQLSLISRQLFAISALRTCRGTRRQCPHRSRGRALPGERMQQRGLLFFALYIRPPYPTPVSVRRFLVFNGLRQGFRSKFLIQTCYLQNIDVKGVMPLFSVCEGYFAYPIHEDKALSFRACLSAASRSVFSHGGAHHPYCRAIAPYSIHIVRRGHIIICKKSADFRMRWGKYPGRKHRIRRSRFLDRF